MGLVYLTIFRSNLMYQDEEYDFDILSDNEYMLITEYTIGQLTTLCRYLIELGARI